MLDVRDYWDFQDPLGSRAAFEGLLSGTLTEDERLEVTAQIARTFSLTGDPAACHATLAPAWDEAMASNGRAKQCYLLESGRGFRTEKRRDEALARFTQASEGPIEDLTIDALHMLGIMAGAEAGPIHEKALAMARSSSDSRSRRWLASLLNNHGWNCLDAGKHEEALATFKEALGEREKMGQDEPTRHAKYAVAYALKALGRNDEALPVFLAIRDQAEDVFVEAQLVDIYQSMGQEAEMKEAAQRALNKDENTGSLNDEQRKRFHALLN